MGVSPNAGYLTLTTSAQITLQPPSTSTQPIVQSRDATDHRGAGTAAGLILAIAAHSAVVVVARTAVPCTAAAPTAQDAATPRVNTIAVAVGTSVYVVNCNRCCLSSC